MINIYILNAFTEKPYSKLMRRNVVYNPITTPSHATSHDRWLTSEYTMVLYNFIGRRRRYDVNNAVPLLVEKLLVNIFLIQFKI